MAGITIYDPKAAGYQRLLTKAPHREVMALALDREGGVWAATQDGGLGRYFDQRWRWYGTESGLPSAQTSWVFVDGAGSIWAVSASRRAVNFP